VKTWRKFLLWFTIAGTVIIGASAAECASGQGGGVQKDNGTGLPDGTISSRTQKGDGRIIEICVKPESGGPIKCNDFKKDDVKGCHEGDYWPDCFDIPKDWADKKR
jgi:hypothetical protein